MLEFDATLTQVVEKFCENVNHFNICENESSSSQYFTPPIVNRSHEDTKTIITFQCCQPLCAV